MCFFLFKAQLSLTCLLAYFFDHPIGDLIEKIRVNSQLKILKEDLDLHSRTLVSRCMFVIHSIIIMNERL